MTTTYVAYACRCGQIVFLPVDGPAVVCHKCGWRLRLAVVAEPALAGETIAREAGE